MRLPAIASGAAHLIDAARVQAISTGPRKGSSSSARTGCEMRNKPSVTARQNGLRTQIPKKGKGHSPDRGSGARQLGSRSRPFWASAIWVVK